eukprot:TRINITY_DN27439_c0_g1_i1.p2 TRINITY_DN27439_c0_g1~~TRINITY_DN27439_c0_g1_i1.p2  ORF type:complete len:624 (+),score=41.77 TRINITY_DN27439_c0_g1_i1:8773-10644(+)
MALQTLPFWFPYCYYFQYAGDLSIITIIIQCQVCLRQSMHYINKNYYYTCKQRTRKEMKNKRLSVKDSYLESKNDLSYSYSMKSKNTKLPPLMPLQLSPISLKNVYRMHTTQPSTHHRRSIIKPHPLSLFSSKPSTGNSFIMPSLSFFPSPYFLKQFMRKNRLKNNSGKRQRVNKSMEEPTNRETTSKPKIIRRRVAFYAKKEELSESKGMGDLQANMVLEKAFGIRVKEQETEKFERYEEEKKLRKTLYKFVNNPEAKQMAREHFAMLAQVKEWQITESITLSKTDFTDYFSSMGFHSTLTENIAEYIVKAVPKLSFKGYYKFLAEGLISTCPYVQKQICYSVYSNCKERLYLSEVYSYFDDTLWRFILDDLLLIYEKLNKSETGELQSRVRSRSEIQRELFAKLNFQSKNQRKRQQENSFLLIDSPTSESVIQFRENVASEEEVKAIIGQKDPYLTFEEFSKISFTEKAPTLLFFMMHLLCGEDLADYYAETVRIKAFRYTLINRNGKKDHLVERKATNHIENSIRRENKELVKKVQKAKPTASQGVINFSIKLFQNLRITEHRTFDPHSSGILKESFVENSVPFIQIQEYRTQFLGRRQKDLQNNYLTYLTATTKEQSIL